NPNFLMDPGEPPITGATVELWSTTSITGQPQLLQSTATDALGRYQFTVNAINGPLPDFGCYQVRLRLPQALGGGVITSQEICQVPAGGTTGMEFVVRGSVVVPPSTTNRAPSIIFVSVEPSGTQPGGTIRLQALGLDQDD